MSVVTLVGVACGQAVLSSLASRHMPFWRSGLLALGAPALATFGAVVFGMRRYEVRSSTAIPSCKYGNETQCKAVFEKLPAIIWTADRFGKPIAVSSSSKHICGHAPEDILNSSRTFLDLLAPRRRREGHGCSSFALRARCAVRFRVPYPAKGRLLHLD
jgi:hypothetical protein